MPQQRQLTTVAQLVRRASAAVDPEEQDAVLAEFEARYEDDDAPVRGVLDGLEERLAFGVDEDPAVLLAQAVVLYLAHRLDQLEDHPDELLRLATRSEWRGKPPQQVEEWLALNGIDV